MQLKFKCPKCGELISFDVKESEVKNTVKKGLRFKKVVKCHADHSYLLYIAVGPNGLYIRDFEEVVIDEKKDPADFADEIFG